MILSPITHKPARLLENIPISLVTEQYRKEVDMDVNEYFKGIEYISLYQCEQTGYRFFYPFDLTGNAAFYEQLQRFDWYYADWKWDYDAALPFIEPGSKVLDIGCGYGNFLVRLKNTLHCDCTGLEFNDKAIKTGRAKGLAIYPDTIQEHAKDFTETYDAVCFFQVLEHIADIDSFLEASIQVLKKGGKLIICVPNNNPFFLQHVPYHSLNMPPHHMGWWNAETFKALTNIYPLQLQEIKEEPLSRFRKFTKLHIAKLSGNNGLKKAFYTVMTPAFIAYFLLNRNKIFVGNILAVYKKQ